jgi:cob(I)alamin adenosyltransferase
MQKCIGAMVLATKELQSPYLRVRGSIQVFTSEERSFFSDVMAQAIRTASQGFKVLVVQFLKGGINQGHNNPVLLSENLTWIRSNNQRCINDLNVTEEEKESILDLWRYVSQVIEEGGCNLVVLDELSLAIYLKFIKEEEVLDLINNRPQYIDVVLTGSNMSQALLEKADQITKVKTQRY